MINLINYFLNKPIILRFVMQFLSEEKQEKIIFASLRNEFAFFGFDLKDFTDEEIKEGVSNVAKTISSFGVTYNEAERAMRVLGKCQ